MSRKKPNIVPVTYKIPAEKRDLVRRVAAQAQADGAKLDDINQSAIVDTLITPESVAAAVEELKAEQNGKQKGA